MSENNASILLNQHTASIFKNSAIFDHFLTPLINHENTAILATLNPENNLYTITINLSDTTKSVSTICRYATAKFCDISDCINFWHCALGYSDAYMMIIFLKQTQTL
jgi:hypothetical protein